MWLVKTSRSPYWQARFPHPDGSGVIVSRSTGQEGKRAAEARGLELEAEAQRAYERERVGGAVTALHVIEEYWDTEASKLKSAIDHVFPHLARIQEYLGERRYCDVTTADVARFCDELGRTVSGSTVNRAISVWRRMHNVAAKKRLYPVAMIDWSQVIRTEPEPKQHKLTPNDVADILRLLPVHAAEIVIFAVATGIRRSQVLGLDWSRVNREDGSVSVYRKHRRASALHTVYLSPDALAVIERRALVRTAGPLFDAVNFRKLWERAVRESGRTGVRFHDLRHAYATWMARRHSLLTVQRQLGHASMSTTLRYAGAQEADVRAAVAATPSIGLTLPTAGSLDTTGSSRD